MTPLSAAVSGLLPGNLTGQITMLLVLFATHVLGGVAAFGSALLALPVLWAMGMRLPQAVALLLVVGLAQAVHMVWLVGRDANRAVLRRMLIGMGCALPVGFLLAGSLPGAALHGVLGAVLVAAGFSHWLERWCGPGWRPGGRLLTALLLVGGLVHGAFGTGGAAVTVYGRYTLPEKAAFRGTLSVMWIIINVPLVAAVGGGAASGGRRSLPPQPQCRSFCWQHGPATGWQSGSLRKGSPTWWRFCSAGAGH